MVSNRRLLKCLFLVGFLFITAIANGQAIEICNDAIDNDGDGQVDCVDSFCNFAANIEKGCRCFDATDNDGDGKIDAADTDCATYYGLSFVGAGSTCSINPPPGTGFSSIAAPQTSSQNTADTPAKIAVGDMNNDGMPDVVVTSKWNSTIQVVATTTIGGFSPGDIMGDFRTPGSNIFPQAGSKYVFEHEVAIADINKDKIGEMYAIASERGGSPNNKPVRFFLTAFKYANNNLIPLFNAVDLGIDRPGSIGIADFDGDGKAEVYLRNRIYAAESGMKLADAGGNWDTSVNAGPVAVNIVGDSKLELVCGPIIYTVPSLASRTLQVLTIAKDMNTLGIPYFPKGYNDINEYGVDQASTTSTADIDGDGFIDVLMTGAVNCSGNEGVPCGTNATTIFYWNVKKNTVAIYKPADGANPVTGWTWGTGRINLGDANGDGKLEALFIAGNQLFCLGLDGAGNLVLIWKRTINDSISGILSLTVYDFNNDGKPEVVYRDSQELVVVDGLTGATKIWSAPCNSHTYTEGPVIADVNGDGNTDICVPCYTNNAFNINNSSVQQQSLGQTRLYYSNSNAWLPTRKVWNQHPYYVTNINDNLTLPFPQIDPSLIFSNAPCPNGLPGPQRPLNLFMNQVPRLSQSGCPEFPAPDLTYFGDNPANPGVDSNGDGVYSPTVVVTPPICGDLAIKAYFNIINSGSLPISDNVPVSFFNGDPRVSPAAAVLLHTTTISVVNLQVGATVVTPTITFNGPGTTFPLYIAMYNNGAVIPIVSVSGQSTKECEISNNFYLVNVSPDPFTVTVEKVSDNQKCGPNVPPYSGAIRCRIFKGAVEVVDYSPYSFQWYDGAGTGTPHAGGTNYNLTGVIDGTYSVVVTNTQKGCVSLPISGVVGISQINPTITLTVASHQTICNPPNGRIDAMITGGNAGYTFDWYDIALTSLGITGPTANNLIAGNYVVVVTKNGCSITSSPATVNGPVIPDAQAQILQNVMDCSTPSSGSVKADAFIAGVLQNPANYIFDWYFYNNVTATRGSILPPANGTGQTRTGLVAGYYQAIVKDVGTQCIANQAPIVQVVSQIVIPSAVITEVVPQTSCNPATPNGVLTATGVAAGLTSPTDFTFEWFRGDNTLAANKIPMAGGPETVSGVKGQTLNSVKGGGIFYTVKVTTALNCSNTSKLIISEDINLPIVTLTSTPNTICNPGLAATTYTGSVSAAVTFKGVAVTDFTNYQFAWHKGSLSTDPVPTPNSTTKIITQQDAGFYTLVVTRTDLACAASPVTTQVMNATVLPLLTTSTTPSTNCVVSKEDGQARIVTVDGVAVGIATGYTYAWTGPVAPAFPVTAGTNTSNTAQVIKVQGGVGYNYTSLVTNQSNGCQTSAVVNVADAKVLPVITLAPTDNGICDPSLTVPVKTFSGKVTAMVTNQIGALTDYTFVFGGGNTVPPVALQTANVFDRLNGGATAYTSVATHTPTGCVSSMVSVPVGNVQSLPLLTTSTTPSTNCVVSKEDGQARIVTVDGVAVGTATGYTYAWTGPVAPAFPVTAGTNTSNTAQVIKVQGGVGYNCTSLVTNQSNGCQTSAVVNVADAKVLPVLTLTPQPNTICDPSKVTLGTAAFDGQIDAVVNNIPSGSVTNDYFFDWSIGTDGNGVDNLPGLDVGTYSLTALHNITGCQSGSQSAQVTSAKTLPAITMMETPSQNCLGGAADGVASVTNVLPNGKNYNYRWFDGNSTGGTVGPTTLNTTATTNDYINVQGGVSGTSLLEYTVEITILQTGCVNTATVGVSDNSQVPILGPLLPTDNTLCTVVKNGAATVSTLDYRGALIAPASYGNFTFTWSGGTQGPTQTITALPAGNYTLTAKNNNDNCISNPVSVTIGDDLFIPKIDVVDVDQTSCNSLTPNGSLTATIDQTAITGGTGITAGYTFTWVDNVTALSTVSNSITNLKGDQTYTITVVRDLPFQCSSSQTIYLNETLTTPAIVVNVTPLTICDVPNGSLSATVVPAGPVYDFFWYDGSDAVDEDAVITGADFTGGSTYSNLVPGDYTLVVQDNLTKCKSQQVIKTIINNAPAILPLAANTIVPTNCSLLNGTLDGGIQLTPNPNNFTTDFTTDELTTAVSLDVALNVNDRVMITQTGILPVPLEANKIYFIESITGTTLKLKATLAGAAIDLTANGIGSIGDFKTAGHTYEWYDGVPSPTTPALGSINYFTNPPVYTGPPLSLASSLGGIATGLYTLQVTNTVTGCKTYLPHTLPFVGAHAVLKINKTNSTLCNAGYVTGDGAIEIQIENPAGAPPGTDQRDYLTTLTRAGVPVAGPFEPGVGFETIPFIVSTTLAPGTYVVEVEEQYSTNFCKILQDVIIDADAFPPVISLVGSIISNTACDATQFNGRIDINVDKDPDDKTGLHVPPVVTTFDISMNPDDAVFPLLAQPSGNYPATNLAPGNYSFTATASTGCSSTKTFTVIDNPAISEFVAANVSVFDAEYCDLTKELSAKVVVSNINVIGSGVDNLNDYQFNWYSDALPFTASAGSDQLNVPGAIFAVNSKVLLNLSGTFPIGLSPGTEYFVKTSVGNDITLSATSGGATIDITVNGVGLISPNRLSQLGDPTATKGGEELSNVGAPLPSATVANGSYWVVASKLTDTAGGGAGGIGCTSAPFSVTIASNKINPQITLTPVSDASCDPAFFEGSIEADVITATGPGNGGLYDYVWAPTGGVGQPTNSLANTGINNVSINVNEGAYSLTATNTTTGCFSTLGTTLLRDTPPSFTLSANVNNQTFCVPFNGSINGLQVFIDSGGGPIPGTVSNFNYVWFRSDLLPASKVLDGQLPAVPVDDQLTFATYAGIAVDKYFVKGVRKAPVIAAEATLAAFAAASAGYTFNIGDDIKLSTGQAFKFNGPLKTAVGDYSATIVEGVGCESSPLRKDILDDREFPVIGFTTLASTSCDPAQFDGRITVTATTAGFGVGTNYNFDWTSDPGGTVVITDGVGVPSPRINQSTALGGPAGERIGPGTYGITVTNTVNQCPVNGSVTLLQNTVPIEVVATSSTPLTHCTAPDGSVTVSVVNVNSVNTPLAGNFTFAWTGPGGPYAGTNVINRTSGDYFVTATKTAVTSPGSGCLSAPFKVTVDDQREFPVIGFTTLASTSCDNSFDGQISVTATTTGFGVGTNYNFDWSSNPPGTTITDRVMTSPYSYQAGDVVGPGNYLITITNQLNSCPVAGAISLLSNPQPVDIVTVSKTDQMICYPDGSIAVTALNSGGTANYSYQWFRSNPGSAPLVDAGSVVINTPSLSKVNYPTMGADIYYVVAIKNTGLIPGSGCATPPFRVNVNDLHVDPRIQFSLQPNTSCDLVNPNGTLLGDAAELNGVNTDTYSFAWTLNGAALPGVTSKVDTNNSSQLTNSFEGAYILMIQNVSSTGCQFSSSIDVNKNLNLSLPNIIDINSIDPLDCIASGSARVASISIGGVTTFNDPPTDLNTNFDFEWYKSNFAPANQLAGEINKNLLNQFPDKYYAVVKDLTTACKSGPTEVVIKDDQIIYPNVNIGQTLPQISCLAVTGTASLAATGDGQTDANSNYTFAWFNTLDITGPQFAITSTIANLVAGNFSVNVTNIATNCSASAPYVVTNDAPIFDPEVSVGGQPRTLCVGQDGSVLARVVNVDPTYPFPLSYSTDLYIGATPNLSGPADFPNLPLVPGFNTNFLQSGLTEGLYTVRMIDNNTGCTNVLIAEVADDRTPPEIVIVEENPLTICDITRPNGQLTATADGGLVGGFNFDWYSSTAVPATAPAGLLVNNDKLYGRAAGDYVVRVTNTITGCFQDKSGAITNGILIPPSPTPEVIQHRTNCIVPNGSVAATVGGSTLNYTFDWYDGASVSGASDFVGENYTDLDRGTYSVTATDAITECVSKPVSIDIMDKKIIPQFIFETVPSYCQDTGRAGVGSVSLILTTLEVSIQEVTWFETSANVIAGTGTNVYELYPGFYRAEAITTEGCTNEGIAEVKTEIFPFNGVSANGDTSNDNFIIDCISNFPNNNVKIFNRSGILVYEANGYNNADTSFKGLGLEGIYLQGTELPVGTYYYIIDKRDGSKAVAGYLELDR